MSNLDDFDEIDRRRVSRLIAEDIQRVNQTPLPISTLKSGRATIQNQIEYYANLLDDATPEQLPKLKETIADFQLKLDRFDAQLEARAEPPGQLAPVPSSEVAVNTCQPGQRSTIADAQLVKISRQITKKIGIEEFIHRHPGIARTSFMEYRASKTTKRVGEEKLELIRAAILAEAANLRI